MLEADEDCRAPGDDELACIRSTHADHQIAVDRAIRVQQLTGARHGLLGDGDDVARGEECVQVAPVRAERRGNDVSGLLRIRIEHVVAPVRIEDRAMRIPIAGVGSLGVGGFEDGKKGGNQIDEHAP